MHLDECEVQVEVLHVVECEVKCLSVLVPCMVARRSVVRKGVARVLWFEHEVKVRGAGSRER